MDLNQDLTSNQTDDSSTRIRKAKEFLQQNPDEHTKTAAHIFNLPPTTLKSSIARPQNRIHSRQNKILQEYQIKALHEFIRSLLACQIQPTSQLIFTVICNLKRAQNPNSKPPSRCWFQKWWKDNGLHKIRAKPLAVARVTAQRKEEVAQWFKKYDATVKEYGIKRRNIVNFDEAGFRVGCPKGQYLLVPDDILEVC
jgi:hypothetical protein